MEEVILRRAEELCFPVLFVAHTTPFVTIERTVAAAIHSAEAEQLGRISRMYAWGRSPHAVGEERLLGKLSAEIGHDIHVVDPRFATECLPAPRPVSTALAENVARACRNRCDRLPLRARFDSERGSVLAVPVSASRPAMMLFAGRTPHTLDPLVIAHLSGIIAMEVQRIEHDRARARASGERLLNQIITGQLNPTVTADQLQERGLGTVDGTSTADGLRFAVPDGVGADLAGTLLDDNRIPYLLTSSPAAVILLFRDVDMEHLIEVLRPHAAHLGLSTPYHQYGMLADALQEARWAHRLAMAQRKPVVHYSSGAAMFLPSTIGEARTAVRHVLGDLLVYDHNHGADLVGTLHMFLATDRSWAAAAEVLHIHRQTLRYRLGRIEAISGRRLRSTADLAELWLALQSLAGLNEGEYQA